jgi:GNAT superfamily N-acetyltransferase
MKIKSDKQNRGYAIKFSAHEDDEEIGRAYLYVIYNDLHEEPYGLMEDVFVVEGFRGKGIGKDLINAVINGAKEEGCRKLITQSRYGREKVHELYTKFGFKDHGKNFRVDF